MSLIQILLQKAIQFRVEARTYSDNDFDFSQSSVTVKGNGTVTGSGNQSDTDNAPYFWMDPAINTSSYYVRATSTGDPVSGTLNTWLSLPQTWGISTANSPVSATVNIQIASDSGGSNIVASGSVYLLAQAI